MKEPSPSLPPASGVNPMWGGHYSAGPAEALARINVCLDAERPLIAEDIEASLAHAAMLAVQGIITPEDGEALRGGLLAIRQEVRDGQFVLTPDLEDVHMNIESRLASLIGEAGGRLHTARSRNDQVATDFRLWVRRAMDRAVAGLQAFQRALVDQAERYAATVMPGFTHLQPAQPITFGHHLLAYAEMAERDISRFRDARARMNECPLGAAALAGTSFPIDRERTAKDLGFAGPSHNSLDAVSDRDFALDYLAAASIAGVHLSRLAEEVILWSTPAFGFVKLPQTFTTGSSIMPQKRNPDAAELVRATSASPIGALMQLLTVMKGQPLAYNKDLHTTKLPVFRAADDLEIMAAAMTGLVAAMEPDLKAMRAAATRGYVTATDLADWLVQTLNLPFRRAHHVTGRIVVLAETKGCRLDELPLADMQAIEPRLTADVFTVLDVERAVLRRTSFGGTAPERVRAEVARWRERFAQAEESLPPLRA